MIGISRMPWPRVAGREPTSGDGIRGLLHSRVKGYLGCLVRKSK